MPAALLVAHGAPADPEPQEIALKSLAAAVGALLPEWQIRGATLAKEGALETALSELEAPLIYPFFMAAGYFTKRELPRRLDGYQHGAILSPLGLDATLPELIARKAEEAAISAGLEPKSTHILLAAHGSKVARSSRDASYAMADRLREMGRFREVSVGLVEEAPFLADAARDLGAALCVPFFALRAGHVLNDLPEALEEAAFQGPCLAPIGEAPEIAALIASALKTSLTQPNQAPRPTRLGGLLSALLRRWRA